MAITIVRDDVARVFCALFHDRDDGVGFGRLVAGEILSAFIEARLLSARPESVVGGRAHTNPNTNHTSAAASGCAQEYSGDLRTASGHNLKDFTAFNARIPEARVPNPLCLRRACGEIARDGKNRSSGIQSVRY